MFDYLMMSLIMGMTEKKWFINYGREDQTRLRAFEEQLFTKWQFRSQEMEDGDEKIVGKIYKVINKKLNDKGIELRIFFSVVEDITEYVEIGD